MLSFKTRKCSEIARIILQQPYATFLEVFCISTRNSMKPKPGLQLMETAGLGGGKGDRGKGRLIRCLPKPREKERAQDEEFSTRVFTDKNARTGSQKHIFCFPDLFLGRK